MPLSSLLLSQSRSALGVTELCLLSRMSSQRSRFARRLVDIGGGKFVQTVLMGPADAPAVLVLHGYGGGAALWYKNLPALAQRCRVYAIDMLGFGRSSRPKFDFGGAEASTHAQLEGAEEFFVDSIRRWRDRVGIKETLTILGHSFGGYVGACYSLRHPEHVTRLVLASPFGVPVRPRRKMAQSDSLRRGRVADWIEKLWLSNVTPPSAMRALGPLSSSAMLYAIQHRFAGLEAQEQKDLADYVHQLWLQPASGDLALPTLFRPFGWAKRPLVNRLPSMQVDTHFLYGEYDWIRPSTAEQLVAKHSCLRSVDVIPECGHQMYLENPDAFNAAAVNIITQGR